MREETGHTRLKEPVVRVATTSPLAITSTFSMGALSPFTLTVSVTEVGPDSVLKPPMRTLAPSAVAANWSLMRGPLVA